MKIALAVLIVANAISCFDAGEVQKGPEKECKGKVEARILHNFARIVIGSVVKLIEQSKNKSYDDCKAQVLLTDVQFAITSVRRFTGCSREEVINTVMNCVNVPKEQQNNLKYGLETYNTSLVVTNLPPESTLWPAFFCVLPKIGKVSVEDLACILAQALCDQSPLIGINLPSLLEPINAVIGGCTIAITGSGNGIQVTNAVGKIITTIVNDLSAIVGNVVKILPIVG